MPNTPITMNKLRTIIRLYEDKIGLKIISSMSRTSRNTVKKYISKWNTYRVFYAGTAKLISQLKIAKAKGTILAELKRIERADLLILDDFGNAGSRLAGSGHHDGHHRGPPSKTVHNDNIAGPGKKLAQHNRRKTVADAILDRLVHHSLRVELFGESIRKRKSKNENVFFVENKCGPNRFMGES